MGQDAAELIRRARFYMPDEYAPGGLVRALADALERVTPRVVTEVAELRGLPLDAIVRSADGSAWRRVARGFGVNLWVQTGGIRQEPYYAVPLPATVLFTPTGKNSE